MSSCFLMSTKSILCMTNLTNLMVRRLYSENMLRILLDRLSRLFFISSNSCWSVFMEFTSRYTSFIAYRPELTQRWRSAMFSDRLGGSVGGISAESVCELSCGSIGPREDGFLFRPSLRRDAIPSNADHKEPLIPLEGFSTRCGLVLRSLSSSLATDPYFNS